MTGEPQARPAGVVGRAPILPLGGIGSAEMADVLAHESACWQERLGWDFAPTAALIRRSVGARVIPGFAIRDGGRVGAYAYFVPAAERSMIGAAHALPEMEPSGAVCRLVDRCLTHLIRDVRTAHLESQFLYFGAEQLGAVFSSWGFRRFDRHYLRAEIGAVRARLRLGGDAAVLLRPLEDVDLASAADIVYASFVGSVDAEMSECYATPAGCLGFLEGVMLRGGCGLVERSASLLACADGVDLGVIVVSEVGPGVAHIVQVSVRPGAQGRGLGRRLLAAAVERLQARGVRELTLSVSVDNRVAYDWYRGLSFAPSTSFAAYVWRRSAR